MKRDEHGELKRLAEWLLCFWVQRRNKLRVLKINQKRWWEKSQKLSKKKKKQTTQWKKKMAKELNREFSKEEIQIIINIF